MSIDRIRYFVAVVETGSLRQAAELAGISPPSMSKAIAALEGELGQRLLYAEGRGIGITEKGLEIYRLAAPLLEEHRVFFEKVRTGNIKTNQLRLATFEVFSTYFISSFLNSEEDLDVLLLEKTPGQMEQAVRTGIVDVGLTYIPAPAPDLEYVEVGSFKMGIFGLKKWQTKAFTDWPFAIPTTDLRIHSSNIESLDMWPTGAPRRQIKYRFELLETAIQTTRMGHSVIHCPEFIIRLQNRFLKDAFNLHQLTPPEKYRYTKPIKVFLIAKKGAISTSLERKLAKYMRSLS